MGVNASLPSSTASAPSRSVVRSAFAAVADHPLWFGVGLLAATGLVWYAFSSGASGGPAGTMLGPLPAGAMPTLPAGTIAGKYSFHPTWDDSLTAVPGAMGWLPPVALANFILRGGWTVIDSLGTRVPVTGYREKKTPPPDAAVRAALIKHYSHARPPQPYIVAQLQTMGSHVAGYFDFPSAPSEVCLECEPNYPNYSEWA